MKTIKLTIFSILGATLLGLGLYSCSNDDTTGVNELEKTNVSKNANRKTTNISTLAKTIFFDNDFVNYKEKYFELEEKFKTKENYYEIQKLSSDDDLFNWIENNIEKTNFNSLAEYKELKNETLNLKTIFIEKFEYDLNFYIKSDKDLQKLDAEIQLVAEELNQTLGGGSGCYNSNVRCINRARNNAAVGLAVSAVSAFFNPIVGIAGAAATSIYLSNALEACSDAFDSCMKK